MGEVAKAVVGDRIRRFRLRRARNESGTALVEAAIVMPVLFFLIFGAFEYGLVFRDYLTLANATRAGARAASAAQINADADLTTLRAIEKATTAIPPASINRVVVFNATTDNLPTPDCQIGTPSSVVGKQCNVYVPSIDYPRLTTVPDDYKCPPGTPSKARYWCAGFGRQNNLSSNLGTGTDAVGIWIEVRHSMVTGFFGNAFTLSDTTIMKIEPKRD